MSRRSDNDNPFDEPDSRRRRRRKRKRHHDDDLSYADQAPTRTKGGRRRWPWVFLLLGLFVFFLPNLIGWTGMQQAAIDYGMSDFQGRISVESVSAGWFQPLKLANVTAVDVDGNPIAQIADVTSSKSLFSLLTGEDYGEFNLQSPVVFLHLRPDGSNLEDALSKYMRHGRDPSTDGNANPLDATPLWLPKLKINILEGQVVVSATSTRKSWQVDGLNATAQFSHESAPLMVDAQCHITPGVLNENDQTVLLNAGGVAFSVQVDSGAGNLTFGSADVALETQNMPLSLLSPALQRFVGPADTDGRMNGKVQAAYDARSNSANIAIEQLTLTGAGIMAPKLIGTDHLMIENATAHGNLQISPTVIAAQQFNVQSAVGKVTADGSFDLNQLTNLANRGQLLDSPFRMDGEIDLARLIQMFPSSLQLHEDLEVQSGTVNFFANSRSENGERRLVLNLDTANLKARRGNRNISWAKPLRLVGTIVQSSGQFALEEVRCESDFLTINGSANLQTASFVAQGDLAKLTDNVGQFVDLGETRLAGILQGSFGWQVGDTQETVDLTTGLVNVPVQIGGSFRVANPVAEFPGMQRWQQQQMSIKLSASGQTKTENKLQLDQGGVQIDIGGEQLVATLAQSIDDAMANQAWQTNCRMTGSMAGWLGHLQNFVDLGEIATSGNLNLTCAATLNSQSIALSEVRYEVQQLAFDGYGVKIREPKAVGTGSLIYDLASGTTTIAETTLSANSISARGNQLKISFPNNMRVDGHVVFQSDVNRMADWFELSTTPESIHWYGVMDGTIQLVSNENGIGGRVNSTITDLIAARQVAIEPQPATQGQMVQTSQAQRGWEEVWRESKVFITGDVSLANDFDAVGFQNLLLDASGLKIKANGSISDLANTMFADLAGTWNPSWEKINSLMQAYTGNLLRFAGQGEHPFAVQGPIYEVSSDPNQLEPWVSRSLQAKTSFGWDQGEILNLPVGASEMQLDLDQSVAVIKTSGIPFAGGVVQFAPKLISGDRNPSY